MDRAEPSAGATPAAIAPELSAALGRRADESGFLRFDRFMEVALYGDRVGYYAGPAPPFGPEGDFYTAPRVSPLFGRTIAAHLATLREELGKERPFSIVELGAGDGTLADSILASLPEGDRGGLEYILVERSPTLARLALERASHAAERRDVSVRLAPSLGEIGPFRGAVVANEVLDAQPARRLRWTGSAYEELGVRLEGDRLVADVRSDAGPIPGPALPSTLEAGQIVEISPMAEALVRETADHLVQGIALFLDYGLEEPALLRGHPGGTLAAVRGHRFVDDPLSRPGATDLSTFVNFTRVREVARRAGLEERAFRSQAEALGDWGFPRWLEEDQGRAPSAEERVRLQLAAKNLLFGFERFRVLELATPPGLAEGPRPT